MSETGYEEIRRAWAEETKNHALQMLSGRSLSRMVSHLSKARVDLAGIAAENRLQASILTQEILNMEFMLRDLLEIRRRKILDSVMRGSPPSVELTIEEEEFHNRLKRAFDGHHEFVKASLTGEVTETDSAEVQSDSSEEEDDGYVMVRFLRSLNEPFVGIDELVHGPFEEGSVAMIPDGKATRRWLEDGTLSRLILDTGVDNRAD